ncbi:glutaredoxin domain-containing cysteine-rich protein CG31559 [Bombyx mori]|uniref:Glutaredoxin domain-containing protein n=1 Tax=Bombyx mori TaxID=7091 RepID=A0A8R1WEP5_BOMMO|nr:glutaredoxin domain-containing cysteine-rich protein CG31559 [Bombyx mori]XP_037871170.1 glutaredoxin domain-containing cysteine-rich protein CG31559 [Bombyx mori]
MEEVAARPSLEYIPPLPPKTKQRGSTTFTQIRTEDTSSKSNGINAERNMDSLSSMHSLVLNSKTPSTTVFIAATQSERPASTPTTDALNGPHVVTIRINTDSNKPKAPKISSVHLKSDIDYDHFKTSDVCRKSNNSLVRLNVDETTPKIIEREENNKTDIAPYIYCNSFSSMTSMVMSSGQCSPSDTLDSGTCSDLDGTPPPLPKKKSFKSNSAKKIVSVTLIRNGSQGELDFEDNDSNISCDSLNSSEFSGSVHTDESHSEYGKKDKKLDIPVAPVMPVFNKTAVKDSFLPQGLLQDIRDRSAKLSTVETESQNNEHDNEETNQNINEDANVPKESAQLTSFRLVSQFDRQTKNVSESLPNLCSQTPLINESTYEERKKEDKIKQEQMFYSSHYFDTDKFYDFHLNEKQFDENDSLKSVSVSKVDSEVSDLEYFAGVKDFKNEDMPSTIKSSKGTIRGVKNRVRAGIATFIQMQNTTKSYKEKDAGKVVVYTTTMGIVRSTYQRCVLVKKILRNLLIKYDERDVFMSIEYQDEIRDRMRSEQILVPQLFVDGQHIGDAETVEKLNESGELRKMLKPYKSPDACTTCQMCGGFRLLPCRICNGSKKSLHRNHFTAEFVALKCMNCDEVGLVRCEACS